MSRSRRPAPGGEPAAPGRGLTLVDQIVLVIVLVLASVLAIAGVPMATALELLAGAGVIAVRLAHENQTAGRPAG
ncbi:hypothetical protein ACZ90_30415 [Streptomyces albus subsp. albus]|nr:hypothetical protein ACZ90_30415 [Streptomyces albus subsp. albus]